MMGPDSDVINLEDDPSEKEIDNSTKEGDDEEEGAEEEESERDTAKREAPTVSSSRVEGEGGAAGPSSQKSRKKRRIIPLDLDVIPNRAGKDPCPYWNSFRVKRE